ncbi:MAG: hypothetical protein GX465_16525 [Acidobacteria bacterium]|jgi:hypothetical protein|nr:MAG: hypothetical protein AO396_07075 [Candidatus Fermentibacter daniensis]NLH78635.1 hypothetical protein [Acidobacteriota bacterium]
MKTALIVIVTLIVASVATVLVTGTGARANYRDQFDELNRINCDADELWEEAFEVNLGSIGSYYDQIMGLGRTAIDMEVREELERFQDISILTIGAELDAMTCFITGANEANVYDAVMLVNEALDEREQAEILARIKYEQDIWAWGIESLF